MGAFSGGVGFKGDFGLRVPSGSSFNGGLGFLCFTRLREKQLGENRNSAPATGLGFRF